MQEEYKKGYRKGYEDGLRDVINEAVSLINRGHQPQELRLMLKSKLAVIDQTIGSRMLSKFGEDIAPETKMEPEKSPKTGFSEKDLSELEFRLGCSYIVRESKSEKSLDIFAGLAKQKQGLGLMRVNPSTLEGMFDRKNVHLYWLTAAEKPRNAKYGFVSPTDLVSVASTISGYLKSKKNKESIILLQGVEYLISQNNFNSVLKMIQRINDYVVMTKSLFLLSINPEGIDSKDYNNLLKEMTDEI